MKIQVDNLSNPVTVGTSCCIIRGAVANYSAEVAHKHRGSSYMMVIHQVVGDNYREVGEIGHAQAVNLIQIADAYPPDRLCHQIFSLVGFDRLHWSNLRFAVREVPLVKLQFILLTSLRPGQNVFTFEFLGVTDSLKVNYQPRDTSYLVKLVYVVCSDDDGSFQAPRQIINTREEAVKKITVAAQVLQCFISESLWEKKLGRRSFELEREGESLTPICHVHQTRLTRLLDLQGASAKT